MNTPSSGSIWAAVSTAFDLIRIRFLGTESPRSSSSNSFPSGPPLQQVARLCPASLARRHPELHRLATLAQSDWATDLLSAPREGTFLVSSKVGCAQGATRYNFVCTHQTTNSTQPSVVSSLSEMVQSSFRSNVVQTASFAFGKRQMYTRKTNWNSTCFQFQLRSGSKVRRYARSLKFKFAAAVLIFRFCTIVIEPVLSVASVFHTGRL